MGVFGHADDHIDFNNFNTILTEYENNYLIFNDESVMEILIQKINVLNIPNEDEIILLNGLEKIKSNNIEVKKIKSVDENYYLFDEKKILDNFNDFLNNLDLKNNLRQLDNEITNEFKDNYANLNNLTNDFYKLIDLYLYRKNINYSKKPEKYLNEILSRLPPIEKDGTIVPNVSILIRDLQVKGYLNKGIIYTTLKQVKEYIKINKDEKCFFFGDVHGDIIPIINLIKNSSIDLETEDWKKLHFVFLGDVIDPFNNKNPRVCNNDYIIFNNIKTRTGICDMHLTIFFLIYLTLKGAKVYYIFGNHDIHYAFSNKLFLYLLDCKVQYKFQNLNFYGKLYFENGTKDKYLINHEPSYYYKLYKIFKIVTDEYIVKIKSNITIKKYQDFYEDYNNFVVLDGINNEDKYLTNNWTIDYLTFHLGKSYVRDDNKLPIGGKKDKDIENYSIICGHQYVYYKGIFDIKKISRNSYTIDEKTNRESILSDNKSIISLDYNSSFYKVNILDKFKGKHDFRNDIVNVINNIGREVERYNLKYKPDTDYEDFKYGSEKLCDYFQNIKSRYSTHEISNKNINSRTIYNSGFVYGLLFQNKNDKLIKKIINQPINYSLRLKLDIEYSIFNNPLYFNTFRNSTNLFLYYKSGIDDKYSMLNNMYENNERMKWFKLYTYDSLIDSSRKYAFTQNKGEIYKIDKNDGFIINDVIFKDSNFINTDDEFQKNIVRLEANVNYTDYVNNLLNDSKRVDNNYVNKYVKKIKTRPFIFDDKKRLKRKRGGGNEQQTYKYSLNELSNETMTYIIFYKYLVETSEKYNVLISFVCVYIKYLLTKEYEQEENRNKKLSIKEIYNFFDSKFNLYYSYNINAIKYYNSWYEETSEFNSMFKINANRFINQLDFENSLYDYIDLYYAVLFISKNIYIDVKNIIKILKENKTKLDNKEYDNVYGIIFKNIKNTTLSYLDYDFIFLICHIILLLYECSISNKQFEEILEQNDIGATKLFKSIINKYNKENLLKEINDSVNYNVIEICNNILKENNLFEQKSFLSNISNIFKKPLDSESKYEKEISLSNNENKFNREINNGTTGGSSGIELF